MYGLSFSEVAGYGAPLIADLAHSLRAVCVQVHAGRVALGLGTTIAESGSYKDPRNGFYSVQRTGYSRTRLFGVGQQPPAQFPYSYSDTDGVWCEKCSRCPELSPCAYASVCVDGLEHKLTQA